MYANLKVKDAIVDRISHETGSRPDSGKERDCVVVQLYWNDDRCWLYLNTSGQKISDRNYRKMPHKAPLRESLAAAIIMATEYDGTQSLVCPMCGSGTLAIEAALIASRRVPGLLRSNYGFMHMKYFDEPAWQQMRKSALKQSKGRGGKAAVKLAPIIATDIDGKAVEAARKNAMTAGVSHLIDFGVCDFADTTIPPAPGTIVLNPEYGLRLGEVKKLQKTYERIGDFFKQKCAGYTGYIFTGNLDLAKKVGLRTSRRFEFYNANIECRLLKYELYAGTRKKRSDD
jgi:putative N6-adenine-specific DNA methylase